jgi:hypothetical protein
MPWPILEPITTGRQEAGTPALNGGSTHLLLVGQSAGTPSGRTAQDHPCAARQSLRGFGSPCPGGQLTLLAGGQDDHRGTSAHARQPPRAHPTRPQGRPGSPLSVPIAPPTRDWHTGSVPPARRRPDVSWLPTVVPTLATLLEAGQVTRGLSVTVRGGHLIGGRTDEHGADPRFRLTPLGAGAYGLSLYRRQR